MAILIHTNLTPWFLPEEKPVRPGVYLTRRSATTSDTFYSHWTGYKWCLDAATPESAMSTTEASPYQQRPWLGLDADPHPNRTKNHD